MSELRTVAEHMAVIEGAARSRTVAVESVSVADARGRVLREAALAQVAVPGFDNSAMDGFAVRYADVAQANEQSPVTLRVVADIPAGSALDPPLTSGQAARIMTGAPLPTDADTVIAFEDTAGGLADSLQETRVLRAPRAKGAHVRRRGEDLTPGDEVLPIGTRLDALQLAALAATGVLSVTVSRQVRVAVVATGSELATPQNSPELRSGTGLARGMIPESNSTLLAELARQAGALIVYRAVVDDDGDGLQRVLREVTAQAGPHSADVVIFSGGVSAGAYEVVKDVLEGQMEFTKVAMQPGKPQGFGALPHGGPLLFGLPGNPVSSAVSFEVFVRPALAVLAGQTTPQPQVLKLPAATGWKSAAGRQQYMPAVLVPGADGELAVNPATSGGAGSHLAGSLGHAQAYAVVAADQDFVQVGDRLTVILIS